MQSVGQGFATSPPQFEEVGRWIRRGFKPSPIGILVISLVSTPHGVSEKAMTAVIVWFLIVLTGPRMDEGGPIAHPVKDPFLFRKSMLF